MPMIERVSLAGYVQDRANVILLGGRLEFCRIELMRSTRISILHRDDFKGHLGHLPDLFLDRHAF